MLGYICKYAPVEIFQSMGIRMERIEPDVTNFNQAEIRMHPNICSFAKGVLEEVMKKDYEGVILTTCCDSIRRLYDVLKEEFPEKFIYMLDTPRITKEAGITLYEQRIRTVPSAYRETGLTGLWYIRTESPFRPPGSFFPVLCRSGQRPH